MSRRKGESERRLLLLLLLEKECPPAAAARCRARDGGGGAGCEILMAVGVRWRLRPLSAVRPSSLEEAKKCCLLLRVRSKDGRACAREGG